MVEQFVQAIADARGDIAMQAAKQLRAVIPRYRKIDDTALRHNLENLSRLLEAFLLTGDDRPLKAGLRGTAQLRTFAGVTLSDFVIASVMWLPAFRKSVIAAAPDVETGLAIYNAGEAKLLPLLGSVCEEYLAATKAMGKPQKDDFELSPFTDEDIDATEPGFR